jgi:5'-methylthioadenosine phosphorylase
VLARELQLCYTAIALVTDYDAGVQVGDGVSQDEVFRVFRENTERLRALVLRSVEALPEELSCPCSRSLHGLSVPLELP